MSTATQSDGQLLETARRVLPGGSFGNFAARGHPRARAAAAASGTSSGNEYVDYLLGSGPMFVGHAHPEVIAAVQAQVAARHHLLRQQRARHPRSPRRSSTRCPAPSRCASSAPAPRPTSTRCALARAFRGRDKILKFEGGYHGMSDYGADEPGAEAARQLPAAVPGLRRHPQERARRDAGRAVQRPRDGRQPDRASTRTSSPASSSSRSSA